MAERPLAAVGRSSHLDTRDHGQIDPEHTKQRENHAAMLARPAGVGIT